MEVLNTVFLIVIITSSVCIIGLVLVQKSKSGGGLGGLASTGGGMDEAFGTQTASVLSKATVFFIVVFFIATISIGFNQRVIKLRKSKSYIGSGEVDTDKKDEKEKASSGDSKTEKKTPAKKTDTPDSKTDTPEKKEK
jgi:protein translocase SecG subunit